MKEVNELQTPPPFVPSFCFFVIMPLVVTPTAFYALLNISLKDIFVFDLVYLLLYILCLIGEYPHPILRLNVLMEVQDP